jgi:hypothetical protein
MRKASLSLTAIVLLSISFISGACIGNYTYVDPGDLVKEERAVSSFNSIEIGGAFEVILAQGNDESLVLEAGENIMDKIITEVTGKTLKIYTEKGCCRNPGRMAVYLTFVDLEFMGISGACELMNEGSISLDNLEMDLSGASEITMNMELDRLEMDLSGASEIDFEGSCGQVYIDASGASEMDALNFRVGSMFIDASGASDCKIYVTDELQVEASGATTVRYKGNPEVSSSESGVSTIKRY